MPYFSVVIPTYNSGKTLFNALRSIIQQNFNDFEILIIDGLSKDDTLEVAKSFNDKRIIMHTETDRGIYDAMNKGIKLARGEWIYFLGCDDILYDFTILSQISNEIQKSKCDIIYGDVLSTCFNGRYDGEFNSLKILSQNICHQAIFFKKTIFNTTGLFDLKYKTYADWDHNLKWFLSPKISKYYIDMIIAHYADGGFSSLNFDHKFDDEKGLKFLLYCKSQINLSLRVNILIRELKKATIKKNIGLFFKIILNIPKIVTGV